MSYSSLLLDPRWKSKCFEILNRDKFICQDCGCLGFYNGGNFLIQDKIDDIDSLFKDWRINDKNLSSFFKEKCTYQCDNFNNVCLEEEEDVEIQSSFFYKVFSLFRENSLYFDNRKSSGNSVKLITEFDCRDVNINAFRLRNALSVKGNSKVLNDFVYCFEFSQLLTNKVHVVINGSNSYENLTNKFFLGQYEVSILFRNILLRIRFQSNKNPIFRGLNVHHKYYVKGKTPWEYKDDALITLCENCHKKRHEDGSVPVIDIFGKKIADTTVCPRCNGSGYLPQFDHVADGICFKCKGEGISCIDF